MTVGNVSIGLGIRRLFYMVTPNETSFERVEDVPDYLNEAIPFFNGAILLEFVFAWLKGVPTFRLNDALSSVSAGIMMQLLKFVVLALELVCQTWVYTNLRIVDLPWNSPLTWWIAFLAMDFTYYWFHRAAHEVNLIWAAHQTHHSSEDYNLTTALRQSVVQHFWSLVSMKLSLYLLPWNSPLTWWIAFLAMDFTFYWFHRAAHEVNLIWAAHQAHHSSEDYNLTTALRQSVVEHFWSLLIYSCLGFILPPYVFLVHVQFNLIYQFWIHTELVKSLGPLEYILNAPNHHRVHHGRNPYCIDKNYAGTLIIWDRLFGTFQEETDEKVVYGLVHPVNTWNPVWIQICHYVHIFKTFWSIEGIKNKIFVLIKGPGWTPGKPRLGDPADIPEIEHPLSKYDSSLPVWGSIYIVMHSIVFNAAFQELATIHMNLTQTNVLGVVIFMMFSITTFGLLMDLKWYAPYMEIFRCIVFLIIDYLLSLRQLDVGVVPLPLIGATRVIYSLSAFLWLVLCLRTEKLLEKED